MKSRMILILFFIMYTTVGLNSTAADNTGAPSPRWISYNSQAINHGILTFYAYYGEAPESLDTLIREGWVPPNLTNHLTGESITTDSADTEIGGWSINRFGPAEMEVLVNFNGEIVNAPWGLEQFSGNDIGIDMESAKVRLYMWWAYISLEAYHKETGTIPSSIQEVSGTMFWPFETATNIYTGEPIQHNSYEMGDLMWEFANGSVTVRLWQEPRGDEESRVGFIQYPLSG